MENIILHIPHSTPCTDFSRWDQSDIEKVRREHDKWTDWHTDAIFGDLSDSNKGHVKKVVFNRSRYEVDTERLIGDPMEDIGQGAIYRSLKEDRSVRRHISVPDSLEYTRAYVSHWSRVVSLCKGDGLLIDCHSFPCDYSESGNTHGDPVDDAVDVCIGFNDDDTYPGDRVISIIRDSFEAAHYKVGINLPFSNSFAPVPGFPSVMIELCKTLYMDEDTLKLLSGAYKVNQLLNDIYRKLLD